MLTSVRLFLATVVVLLATAVGACGVTAEAPPSKDELIEGLRQLPEVLFGEESAVRTVPQSVAACAADVFLDAGLSLETLRAIARGEKGFAEINDDAKTLILLTPQLVKCVADELLNGAEDS